MNRRDTADQGNTLTIGDYTFTFVTDNPQPNAVPIGADEADTFRNAAPLIQWLMDDCQGPITVLRYDGPPMAIHVSGPHPDLHLKEWKVK